MKRSTSPRRGGRLAVSALALSAALVTAGCSEPSAGEGGRREAARTAADASSAGAPVAGADERPARADVILISLDTLRCDALGPWRTATGKPSLTPHLDALAGEAVVYANAYAPMPWTLPSHMSIFTGLDPEVHRVLDETSRLSPRVSTLPEILERLGYLTLGVATVSWLDGTYGFGRGFYLYRLLPGGLRPARIVNQAAATLLSSKQAAAGQPLFLFLHYYDPHSDFSDDGNRLPYAAPEELLPPGLDTSDLCHEGRCATDFLTAVNRGEVALDERRLAVIRTLYEAGVRTLDADLGALFAFLRQRGRWDDALVIVTSDHGEEFLEHGKVLHQQGYRETACVPLVIKLPRGAHAGSRVETPVSTVELAATVLAFLEEPPPGELQGRDLTALVGVAEPPPRPAVTRSRSLRRPRYFVRTAERTLLYDPRTGAHRLYDLETDPGESEDLAAARPAETAALAARAKEIIGDHLRLALVLEAAESGAELSDEQRRELRALGYLQ